MSKIVPISFHAVFQFHYGTIKSIGGDCLGFRFGEFQFHYGTIKSDEPIEVTTQSVPNFNSTMVRLKGKNWRRQLSKRSIISIPLWYD